MADIDTMKALDKKPMTDQGEEGGEVIPGENSKMMEFLKPKWATKILTNNMGLFTFFLFFQYLMEMSAYIASANFYSDVDRLTPCTYVGPLSDPNEATKVYDMPILLLGIFHLITWLRVAVLCCVVCLGINLMQVWYWTLPVTIYGLVVYVITAMTLTSEDSAACSDVQTYRHQYLVVELIACWAFILLNLLPFLICCMSKTSHAASVRKSDDEGSDDEGEGEDE